MNYTLFGAFQPGGQRRGAREGQGKKSKSTLFRYIVTLYSMCVLYTQDVTRSPKKKQPAEAAAAARRSPRKKLTFLAEAAEAVENATRSPRKKQPDEAAEAKKAKRRKTELDALAAYNNPGSKDI